MTDVLTTCLEDLQSRIDEKQEEMNLQVWRAYLDNQCQEEIFNPLARAPSAPKVNWPDIHINDALDNIDLMCLSQFKLVSESLAIGSNRRLNVRCNYGTGILPCLFGCELFVMPRDMNTLPTAVSLHSLDRIKRLVASGVPDLHIGLGGKVFDCVARFLELFHKYPLLARHVALYHPDTQGPIDVAEVVWGSEIFLAFYDDHDLVKALLEVITQTYSAFLRKWFELAPARGEYSTHWGLLHKGRLALRNDSLMNLSPSIYKDMIRPMDQRIFDEFGGGIIHFCGRGDHFIQAMSEMRGLTAINISQPHLNNMETIYRYTVDKGIKLIQLNHETAEKARAAGRLPKGQVQC